MPRRMSAPGLRPMSMARVISLRDDARSGPWPGIVFCREVLGDGMPMSIARDSIVDMRQPGRHRLGHLSCAATSALRFSPAVVDEVMAIARGTSGVRRAIRWAEQRFGVPPDRITSNIAVSATFAGWERSLLAPLLAEITSYALENDQNEPPPSR